MKTTNTGIELTAKEVKAITVASIAVLANLGLCIVLTAVSKLGGMETVEARIVAIASIIMAFLTFSTIGFGIYSLRRASRS